MSEFKGSVGCSMIIEKKPPKKQSKKGTCSSCKNFAKHITYCKNFKFKVTDTTIAKNCKAFMGKQSAVNVKKSKPTNKQNAAKCNKCSSNNYGWCTKHNANRPQALKICKKK